MSTSNAARKSPAATAAERSFLPVVRELARAYQAFAAYDAAGYRNVNLTVPQADVLFSLGNTDGLTCKELGEKTLITKGTLTGVLDRLESKGLIRRVPCTDDRRVIHIRLTARGERLFEKEFPRQLDYLGKRFARLNQRELRETETVLRRLRELF